MLMMAMFLRKLSVMNLIQKLIRSLAFPCLHCGSFRCEQAQLCQHCFATLELFQEEQLHHYEEAPYPIYAQYEWNPGESDVLSSLFLSLKGRHSQRAWQEVSTSFVRRRLSQKLMDLPIKIVPAPSSTGCADHAYFWGKSLASCLEAELYPCLIKGGKTHQRGASRRQRQRLRIEVDEKYSGLSKESTEVLWIFVDDILTTGSTAHAAYEALGSPPHFEVWVLGRRSLSCGASRYLL